MGKTGHDLKLLNHNTIPHGQYREMASASSTVRNKVSNVIVFKLMRIGFAFDLKYDKVLA